MNGPVWACQISLVSPRSVSIIDFSPQSCPKEMQASLYSNCISARGKKSENWVAPKTVALPYPLPKIFKLMATKPLREYKKKIHKRRHHKKSKKRHQKFTLLEQEVLDFQRGKRRVKRQQLSRISGDYGVDSRILASGSPYQVVSDLVVQKDVTLTVEKGVKLRFNPSVGLTVKGTCNCNNVSWSWAK